MANGKNNRQKTNRFGKYSQPFKAHWLAVFFIVFGVALAGSYYLGFGRAATPDGRDVNMHFTIDDLSNPSIRNAQPGSPLTLRLGGNITNASSGVMQAITIASYDTSVVELLSTTCNHAPGCYRSQLNPSNLLWGDASLHEHRIVFCLNGPGQNTTYNSENFITMQFKSKASFDAVYRDWFTIVSGGAPGSCNDNRAGVGYAADTGYGYCSVNGYACERGVGQGIDDGGFQGFSAFGDTNPPQTQVSTAPASSTTKGSGGSGSGLSANTVEVSKAAIPSSSGQGNTEQRSNQSSPFFDGKVYKPGSDGLMDFANVNLAGRKVNAAWFYLLSIVLAVAISGISLWRWRLKQGIKPRSGR